MRYFDFETIARKAEIPEEQLKKLCELVRQDFPGDQMMYELHVLRACLAILEGRLTVEQAIRVQKAA